MQNALHITLLCMLPQPVLSNELFGFDWLFIEQQCSSFSNNASSKCIPQDLKNFIYTLSFYKAKISSVLHTAAECDLEQTKTWLCSIWIINAWLKFHSVRTYWHLS